MKKIVLIFTGLLFSFAISAQDNSDTAWTVNSDASLMFSQSAFSNWAAGGENNLTFNAFFNFYAGYHKGKSKWENMLGLAYGQSKTGEKDFRKSEDKIDFLSTYGYEAAKNWFYSANVNFKSQFAEGYNYHSDTIAKEKISNFMAPAYISLGIGMENRPKEWLSIYISPATARWIIVNDQDLANMGSFGVDPAIRDDAGNIVIPGETSRFEAGAYFRIMLVKEVFKNVGINTKLELFSDYLDNPQNVDINWDTRIDMKVNSWLSANFAFQMLYDDNTPITLEGGGFGPRLQMREALSVGLTYKVSNKK